MSSGSLACFDSANKLNIGTLTKEKTRCLTVDLNGDQIRAIPGSPIPAFIVTNKNVQQLIYIKESQVQIKTLKTRASLFLYPYMADRHILLEISSPSQVCNNLIVKFFLIFLNVFRC